MRAAQSQSKRSSVAVTEQAVFAAQVRAARAVLGWSQSRLGEEIGLSQRSVHRIELGEVDIRWSTISAIERAFEVAGVRFERTDDGAFAIVAQPKTVGAADDTSLD